MVLNETKYMESVIALAEELNFTLAAQKLRVSQPVISRNLAEVEARLGGRLFDRDRKNVRLNKAGQAYLDQARIALLYGDRAFQAAKAALQDVDTIVHVGRSPYVDPFLCSILFSVQKTRFPRLRIDLSSQYSFDLAHEVLAGELDLAIANEPPESSLLTTVKIAEAPFYIAMSEEDDLARNASVTLDDLADRCWIMFERRLHPTLYDKVFTVSEAKRSNPSKIQHVTGPEEAFPSVNDGACIAFVAKAGALRIARDGVTVRPLMENSLSMKTYLISRSDNESKVVSALVRSFMQQLESTQPDRSTAVAEST
jgi:DNA-binding transcriptional LysR family regulator